MAFFDGRSGRSAAEESDPGGSPGAARRHSMADRISGGALCRGQVRRSVESHERRGRF
jgi:hypothetical protein